jgi:3-O-alpha-D-mannopyranosyl-alpha-D-mannopyranose xylosylphosphotransferase
MRSVLAALPGHLGTFHLMLADFPFSAKRDLALLPERAVEDLEAIASSAGEHEYAADDGENGALNLLALKFSRSRGGRRRVSGDEPGKVVYHVPDESQVDMDKLIRADSAANHERDRIRVSSRLASWLESAWRVVQTPTWIAFDRIDLSSPDHPLHRLHVSRTRPRKAPSSNLQVTSHPSLRYAAHSEIFHLPSRPAKKGLAAEPLGVAQWKEEQWIEKALPTFNSMAIESRIGWLPGLAEVSRLLRRLPAVACS